MKKVEHKGVIVPMVTPFKENEDLDEGALRKLTNFLIGKGVHGLFPAGSTGEGWAFGPKERKRVIEIVVEEARGRVPVYAGTGGLTTREAIELAKMAESCGIDALVVITPFYIAPTQDELYDHYAAICRATRLPVFPYTNPARTNVRVLGDLAVKLSQIENLAGIKDSSGDMALTMEFIKRTPPTFAVFQGRDDIFAPSLAIGAKGIVAATANVAPDLVLDIYNSFVAGNLARSIAAQNCLSPLRAALSLATFPEVIKEAMRMIGMPMGPCRAPVGKISEKARQELRKVLVGMEILNT